MEKNLFTLHLFNAGNRHRETASTENGWMSPKTRLFTLLHHLLVNIMSHLQQKILKSSFCIELLHKWILMLSMRGQKAYLKSKLTFNFLVTFIVNWLEHYIMPGFINKSWKKHRNVLSFRQSASCLNSNLAPPWQAVKFFINENNLLPFCIILQSQLLPNVKN